MSWQSPIINTNVLAKDQLPDPVAQAYTLNTIRVVEIPADPAVEHVGAIVEPDVERNYGWRLPQLDNQITYMFQPLQSPGVSQSSPAFTKSVQQAAKPVPTLGATGITGALRAPGINEGY